MLSTPREKTYPPLNRPSPPLKLLSIPIPPLLRIFKNLQSPSKSWGDSHYVNVLTNINLRSSGNQHKDSDTFL